MLSLNNIELVTDDLLPALNEDHRKQHVSNYKIIKEVINQLVESTNDLKTDHEDILKRLDKIEAIEKENAEKLDQQHLNMQQLVTILHDDFDVPITWDGENLVKEKEV